MSMNSLRCKFTLSLPLWSCELDHISLTSNGRTEYEICDVVSRRDVVILKHNDVSDQSSCAVCAHFVVSDFQFFRSIDLNSNNVFIVKNSHDNNREAEVHWTWLLFKGLSPLTTVFLHPLFARQPLPRRVTEHFLIPTSKRAISV